MIEKQGWGNKVSGVPSLLRSLATSLFRRESPGQTMMIALLVMLFFLPMGIVAYKYAMQAMKNAVYSRRQKTAYQVSSDIVSDYMRQFSQDSYQGHYDSTHLDRAPTGYYANTISSVTYFADPIGHTLTLSVKGSVGTASNILTHRTVDATFKFLSSQVQYGSYYGGGLIQGGPSISTGPFYIGGVLNIQGNNTVFSGGPVVAGQGITCTGCTNAVIDGDVYYGAGYTIDPAVTVLGQTHNYLPQFTYPTINSQFYAANYSTNTLVYSTITFFDAGMGHAGSYQWAGEAVWHPIPASGLIVYAKDADIAVMGHIDGLVTVVADEPGYAGTHGCARTKGRIWIKEDLVYAGGALAASAGHSFAAIARNCIIFDTDILANHMAVGAYYVQNLTDSHHICNGIPAGTQYRNSILIYQYNNGGHDCTLNAEAHPPGGPQPYSFTIYGSNNMGKLWYNIYAGGGVNPTYDPNLKQYQAPGLPENAYLVNFNLH